jgi:serine/threonine-protein kinase
MPAFADRTPQQHFARLRGEFHVLLGSSIEQRKTRLAQWSDAEPAFAAELAQLLAALDESDLSPVSEPDLRGLRVGPYRIECEIGRGGMGIVYRAQRADGAFEQQVALKLLPVGTRSRALAQSFLRERQILARLVHPNIARLLDGGLGDDGRPWLAMEYVDGVELTQHCRQRALGLRARVALLQELGLAVAYAHSQLIVHRDIKPSNVMVDEQGRARLLDFGIARLEDDSELAATLTGVRALTPRYAAPEQLRGERAGTAADVYALGILLQELTDELTTRERARDDLQRIIAKATAAESAARYASVAIFCDDLSDWLAVRPLRSGIGSARARLASLWIHHRWPLLAVAGVLLALLLGAALTLRQARIAEHEARIAQSNLAALLDVLAAASPDVYAGRDPQASEFLMEAARRLENEHADQPLLIWRSHSQIAVGLLNLGHFDQATALLHTALRALDRLQPADPTRQLDTLRYLVIAQRGSADVDAVVATGTRIAAVASAPDTPAGPAISALASAANTLSRSGQFAPAQPWLDLAETIRLRAPSLPAEALENYWRQRGWVALRQLHLDAAAADLTRSLAVIDAAPNAFAPLRRAEAELLLTEVDLLGGDARSAQARLARAEAAVLREYPATHVERSMFTLIRGRAAILAGQGGEQLTPLRGALDTLQRQAARTSDASDLADLALARAAVAAAAAAQGDCTAAAQQLALLDTGEPPSLPSRRAALAQMRELARARCAGAAAQGAAPP